MATYGPIVFDSTTFDSLLAFFDAGPVGIANVPDNSQVLRLDTRPYRIRLVQPASFGLRPITFDLTPFDSTTFGFDGTASQDTSTSSPTVAFMGRDYIATNLPMPTSPVSPDLVEGVVNLRLNDAGDFQLTFPSTLASSGIGRWKDVFNVSGHLQWIEIYRDDVLEFVGCVQQSTIGRDQVQVSGVDGFGMLKKWFENDNYLVAGPRDVISTYTRLPQVIVADDFVGTSLQSLWGTSTSNGGTFVVGNGVAKLTNTNGNSIMNLSTNFSALADDWRVTCTGNANPTSGTSTCGIYIQNAATSRNIVHANTPSLGNGAGSSSATLTVCAPTTGADFDSVNSAPYTALQPSFTITLEKRGRWFQYFFNGTLVGRVGVPENALAATQLTFQWNGPGVGVLGAILNLQGIYLTSRVPFLETSSDHGSYVLPSAEPYGGLLANYYADTDLVPLSTATATPAFQGRVFHPEMKATKPTSTRVDSTLNFSSVAGTWNLPVGSNSTYFSARWTGSVYLKMSAGNYTISATVDDYCKVWIGQTRQYLDTPIIDNSLGSTGTYTGTVSQANVGSVDGWYPIIVEYVQYAGAYTMQLSFTPPTSYTDPGGATLAASSQIIPATSLSPNGIYEARIQGQSAFDLVQQTAKDFGYSLYCEPKQLESGQFPGNLVARVREGRDTDVVLRTEDLDTDEPLISPQVTYDATALANVVRGSAQSLQDGSGAPAQIEAYDAVAMSQALFAIEAWQDAGDGANVQLLTARQSGVLSLADSPWQNLTGTPRGIERLADSFPLTGTLSAMRWRPGDGVRVKIPEITVDDQTPRQILQVSRTFTGTGRTATSVGFRQRPRNPVETIRQMMRAVNYPNRIRKQQLVTLVSNPYSASLAAAANTGALVVNLGSNDQIQNVILRIAINSQSMGLTIYLNGSGTAWVTNAYAVAPVDINLSGVAARASATDPRFYVSITNAGASNTNVNAQLIATVLR